MAQNQTQGQPQGGKKGNGRHKPKQGRIDVYIIPQPNKPIAAFGNKDGWYKISFRICLTRKSDNPLKAKVFIQKTRVDVVAIKEQMDINVDNFKINTSEPIELYVELVTGQHQSDRYEFTLPDPATAQPKTPKPSTKRLEVENLPNDVNGNNLVSITTKDDKAVLQDGVVIFQFTNSKFWIDGTEYQPTQSVALATTNGKYSGLIQVEANGAGSFSHQESGERVTQILVAKR